MLFIVIYRNQQNLQGSEVVFHSFRTGVLNLLRPGVIFTFPY
jgi:hypothetical protein